MEKNPFPHEYYVHLEHHPFLEGRIIVNLLGLEFSAEIDLVQAESRKIFHHVAILYKLSSEKEALDQAYYRLTRFVLEREGEHGK